MTSQQKTMLSQVQYAPSVPVYELLTAVKFPK